jgi:putative transposase
MKRVEKHIIKRNHKWFAYCDEITNTSRKLYNSAQYTQRQSLFYGYGTLSQANLDRKFQSDPNYRLLPAKVAQLVLKQCADAWTSYFAASSVYATEPKKFTGKPKVPSYIEARNLVKFNNQALGKREFKKGKIVPSMSPICIPVKDGLRFEDLCEVRIVPKTGCYIVEVVYEQPDNAQFFCSLNPELVAAIDIGLDNLATVVFSDPTIRPLAINGKPLKSANQFYNKQVAKYRGFMKAGTSRRLQNIICLSEMELLTSASRSNKSIADSPSHQNLDRPNLSATTFLLTVSKPRSPLEVLALFRSANIPRGAEFRHKPCGLLNRAFLTL